VCVELRARQVVVDILTNVERRHDIQSQPGDDAERAEREHHPVEFVAVGLPTEGDQVAVRGHELDRRDGGRQVPVAVAGAVGAGRARTGDADVRQRTGVAQREAGGLQVPAQFAVAGRCTDRDPRPVAVDGDEAGQAGERHQIAGGVGDPVERVAGAEHPDVPACGDQPLQFADGRRLAEPRRRERTSPAQFVRWMVILLSPGFEIGRTRLRPPGSSGSRRIDCKKTP